MHVAIIAVSATLLLIAIYVASRQLTSVGRPGMPFLSPSKSECTFLSASDTASFLMADPDTYTTNLSSLDLHARRAASYQEYQRASARSARSFTPAEKLMLTEAARKADSIISGMRLEGYPSFAKNMRKIPWIFASTEGTVYEDGLPHTRLNVIFLSSGVLARFVGDDREAIRTLIHEKIHIQQRLHPVETLALLKQRGYIQWKERLGVPRIRANPDLDPWIYVDPKTQKGMAAYYTSETPTSISDITLSSVNYEHPYEMIAYEVTQHI